MAGRSCTTQLLEDLDIWSKIFEDGNNIYIVYLDSAKAFDIERHHHLLRKLERYGVQGIWNWLQKYLKNMKQCMVLNMVNGENSSYGEVTSGTRRA